MICNLCLLLLGLAASPMAGLPASAGQRSRARVALELSDSDTTASRWASIGLLDSLLPMYLDKKRVQYADRSNVRMVTEVGRGPPGEWTLPDLVVLGQLLRMTFFVELHVFHTPERGEVCARVVSVRERAVVDSACVKDAGSTVRAVRQLAPQLGRVLNRLSGVPASSPRPHLTNVGADSAIKGSGRGWPD